MPKSGESIIPMMLSSGSGTNLREVTIEIIPKDRSASTEVTVRISIINIIIFISYHFEHNVNAAEANASDMCCLT